MRSAEYVDLLAEVLAPRYQLPDGYDSWGIKSVRPDLHTRHGYRWPWPGNATPRAELEDHDDSCPRRQGDGVCVATTWCGMASGGFPARTLLLLAYRAAEARGTLVEKLRVPQAFVVDVIDGELLLRDCGRGADLAGAYLAGAGLADADLAGANLTRADLTRADLTRANLTRANLAGANLTGADLADAYLAGANLTRANLTRADLTRANLTGADLADAGLAGANLTRADLARADLARANLTGADLADAYLAGALNIPSSAKGGIR